MTSHRIHLYGKLAKYGTLHTLYVDTPSEAIYALAKRNIEFKKDICEGFYNIIRGDKETGQMLNNTQVNGGYVELNMSLGDISQDLHIVPILDLEGGGERSKDQNIGKVLVGATLAVGSFFIPPAAALTVGSMSISGASVAFQVGALIALSGVGGLLQPTESEDKTFENYFVSATGNLAHEGTVLPVLYGDMYVQGYTVSSNIESTDRFVLNLDAGNIPVIEINNTSVERYFNGATVTDAFNIDVTIKHPVPTDMYCDIWISSVEDGWVQEYKSIRLNGVSEVRYTGKTTASFYGAPVYNFIEVQLYYYNSIIETYVRSIKVGKYFTFLPQPLPDALKIIKDDTTYQITVDSNNIIYNTYNFDVTIGKAISQPLYLNYQNYTNNTTHIGGQLGVELTHRGNNRYTASVVLSNINIYYDIQKIAIYYEEGGEAIYSQIYENYIVWSL